MPEAGRRPSDAARHDRRPPAETSARQRLAHHPPGRALPLAGGRPRRAGARGGWRWRRCVVAKLATVVTPFFFKAAVDGAGAGGARRAQAGFLLAAGPVALTLFYGLMRLAGVGFAQLRDGDLRPRRPAGAAPAGARDLPPHPCPQPALSTSPARPAASAAIIERGVKGVDFLLRFLLFSIVPLVLELALVGAILFFVFDVWYLRRGGGDDRALRLVHLPGHRVAASQIRERMNERDTDANQKAIDSLLNFETVKYFGAEEREAARYDGSMRGYEAAAVETEVSLAWLNLGQTLIITAGLVAVMVMAARGVQAGALTVGDFVMVNAYMIQITLPLGFLGTRLPRDPPEPRRHGGDVRPARAAGGDRRPARRAAARGERAGGSSSATSSFAYETGAADPAAA